MSEIKKKKVSKKRKIAWRKHVNIDDVDAFLEDKRLEERLGEPLAVKANEELFHVDTNPSDNSLLSAKQKRRLRFQQPPKCFSMLQPHTKVPDPIAKRNRVRTKEERKNVLVKNKENERKLKGILKPKELQALKDQKMSEAKKKNIPKLGEFNEDLWNDKDPKETIESQWINASTKYHTLRGTGRVTKNIPKSLQQKKSVIPAVEVPHPGASYNPSFLDHQNLLQEIVQKELKIIKEEKHIERVTKNMFSKVTAENRDNNWLTEMSEGLPNHPESQDDENSEEYKSINPPVKNKKKSDKQRRKQKEQQKLEAMHKLNKVQKKKIADIYKLKFLNKAIVNQETKSDVVKQRRIIKKEQKLLEPQRLGTIKFEPHEVDINMCEDIAGNLRNMKKEGSLLKDRFKSMQKRNILQPTVKHIVKKAKIKKFTKPGFKDDWKVTIAKVCLSK